ncbi:DUF1003 domain-containing protein [Azospirillum canadense]|uniref:DUF1003 domain-containing protein n=1 Tax=Azospirillum canadense TaxID=403962 RepID=UPI002225FA86|nr:DUF1003 domain-containing protein [Azospirillum canadense]MCW2239130.1 hypothetical protein [Azospirillum canadense]
MPNTLAIEEGGRSFRFGERQAASQRLVDHFTIMNGSVDDHPAIIIEPGRILRHNAVFKRYHHAPNVMRQKSPASAQTYTRRCFYAASQAVADLASGKWKDCTKEGELRHLAEEFLNTGYDSLSERERNVISHIGRRHHVAQNVSHAFEEKLTIGDRLADGLDYEVNFKAEVEITRRHEKPDHLRIDAVLARLDEQKDQIMLLQRRH